MQSKSIYNRILVYIDGSEESIAAAKYGIILAKLTGSSLKAIYVVNKELLDQLERARVFVKVEKANFERDLEEDGRDYLNEVIDLAVSKGVAIETELVKGTVHRLVIQKAEEWGADLIIIGEHEEGLSKQDVLYSEIALIFRKARCSVLIAKDTERIEQLFDEI